jgi:hypothetical protein
MVGNSKITKEERSSQDMSGWLMFFIFGLVVSVVMEIVPI